MLQRFLLITLTLCSLTASAQWQQTGSKVRYVNGLGIPTKDTAAGVAADSSQIVIRPADSALYIKYKRTWLRVGGGGGSIAGSGTTNYVPKFTSATAIGNSQIFDDGTNVGVGYTAPVAKLAVSGTVLVNTNTDDGVNKLQVNGQAKVETIIVTNNLGQLGDFNSTNANGGYLTFSTSGSVLADLGASQQIFGTGGNSTFGINARGAKNLVFGANNTERMRITSGGAVLVNTTTDNGVDKLQVSGSVAISSDVTIGGQTGAAGVSLLPVRNYSFGEGSGTSYVNLFRQANSAAAVLGYGYKYSTTANGFASSIAGSFAKAAISVNGNISFYADNATNVANGTDITPSERMRITTGGAVLINTTTDNGVDKLQVSGSMNVSTLATTNNLSVTTNATVGGTAIVAGNFQAATTSGNVSLRTTASPYPVNMTLGANTGMGFYQDGTTSSIIATNQTLTATNDLQFLGTKYTFSGTSSGKVTINTSSDNGVDYLQVNGSISGIGMKQAYVTKTGAYTATNSDYVIDCTSGTFTVTLPASSGRTGRILIIKNSGAGTITVDGNSSETIDGAATYSLSVQYATVQIMSDGTNWKIISKF